MPLGDMGADVIKIEDLPRATTYGRGNGWLSCSRSCLIPSHVAPLTAKTDGRSISNVSSNMLKTGARHDRRRFRPDRCNVRLNGRKLTARSVAAVSAGLLIASAAALVARQEVSQRVTPNEIKWPSGPSLTVGTSAVTGIETVVLKGDPRTAGLYTILLRLGPNTRLRRMPIPMIGSAPSSRARVLRVRACLRRDSAQGAPAGQLLYGAAKHRSFRDDPVGGRCHSGDGHWSVSDHVRRSRERSNASIAAPDAQLIALRNPRPIQR